jgi:hypothetical protein
MTWKVVGGVLLGLVLLGMCHNSVKTNSADSTPAISSEVSTKITAPAASVTPERSVVATPTAALTDAQIRAQNDVVLSHLKTATPDKIATPEKAVRLWKNARLDVWEKYYGKPETITSGKEADGVNSLNDTPASYRWNIERLELTVAFAYQEGHEIKIDVEARDGKDPLTLAEAQTFASALGLPGPIHTSRNPTAAAALEDKQTTWGSGDFVAYFDDTYPETTSFYFENSPR